MVPIMSLWLPIVLAAVIVFIVSSIIQMVLPYHRSDYRAVPSEDAVMEAMRKFNIPPGDYMMPRPASMKDMGAPQFKEKREKGPVAVMTILPPGPANMTGNLVQWFLYSIVIGVFTAYVTGRVLPAGTPYLQVFRVAGTVAFMGYALALWQNSIWYRRAWSTTIKSNIDGLIYGLMTAGTFGWLWPR